MSKRFQTLIILKLHQKVKSPCITDNGKKIGDSASILDYLKDNYGDPLDQKLDPDQKATSHACKKMMDENLY